MTDQRLREAERLARACPSLESEAALLHERLRAGTLSLERLELAAYCGHEGALAIVPRPKGAPSDCGLCHGHPDGILVMHAATSGLPPWTRYPCEHELAPWVQGLDLWGHGCVVRAAIAAARFWASWGPEHQSRSRDPRVVLSLKDLDEWEQTGHLVGDRPFAFPWHTLPSWEPVRQAWLMAHDGGTVERRADSAHAMAAIMASAESCGEAPVRAAIQSTLISWALGSQGQGF